MKINKTIVNLDLEHFNTGKICRWKDFVFVFDVTHPGMAQLSTSFKVIGRLELKEIKQIDSVFFDENFLIIADSMNKKIHRWEVKEEKESTVTLSSYAHYPLPSGSIIAAFGKIGKNYVLLDKGLSMIRTCDPGFNEIRTVGSRMGYIREYEEEGKQRLGFEFPEDMVIIGNRVLVSDSGNKRLVVIEKKWQQEKTITLPEFPYKFLFHDENRDVVVVSDFDRSLMVVSLKYGFVSQKELDEPVDFFQSFCDGRHSLVGSERTKENELVALEMPEIPLESLAKEAGNLNVLMRVKIEKNRLDQARAIALAHEELLPEYAKYTAGKVDETVKKPLSQYVEKTVQAAAAGNDTLKKDISKLSMEFIKKYKAIPDSEDTEAANIDKENIRHRMFLKLKEYRSRLRQVVDIKNSIQTYPESAQVVKQLLDTRFREVKQGIEKNLQVIENNLLKFNETDLLGAIVHYWLWAEEERFLFGDAGLKYEKLFDQDFLLAILNHFYYNIAKLFLKRHKVEEYILFADREITMYPDKLNIFKLFAEQLFRLKKHDDVLRMLKKFPDQNKENVNYFYYRIYLGNGDIDKAFFHLKKELELYSHRFELIPQLIRLNKLNREEVVAYIDKVLGKAGQSIDKCLVAAKAFHGIGDIEKTGVYVDKELEHFPENNNAIAFKLDLLLNSTNREEMEKLVTRLTSSRFSLIRSKVYFVLEDFDRSWTHFRDFLKENPPEATAMANLYLLASLNYLDLNQLEIAGLLEAADRVMVDIYKKEFLVFLSFLKYFREKEIGREVEKFNVETYLSAYSTGVLAYDYFTGQLEQLKDEQKWDELFTLAERILKYNPGDETIFEFLEGLVE